MGKRKSKLRDFWENSKKFEVSIIVTRDRKLFETYLITNIEAKDCSAAIESALKEAQKRVDEALVSIGGVEDKSHQYGFKIVRAVEIASNGNVLLKKHANDSKKIVPPVPARVFSCPVTVLCTVTKVLGSPRAATQL